jgi:N-formylglutamate deformylase
VAAEPLIDCVEGTAPLVISLPHVATRLPPELAARMTARARAVPDTDWHVERLYAFARTHGVSWLEPRLSRYVVDLNRPPDDAALYPGQASTGLCPTETFDGEPLYHDSGPDPAEVDARRERYWRPYHDALAGLIAATRARHGYALVLDAHSIRSQVPRLFAGRLPDLNLGTHDGRASDPGLAAAVVGVLAAERRFTHVLDGRFKGGYITRAYGRPAAGVHALQIEIGQACYMDEASAAWDAARAAPLVELLERVVGALLAFRPPGAP